MRRGMPGLTCVDVVVVMRSVVIRNDAPVTHRLLQSVRRLFGRRARARAERPASIVE
jgi:hypothetical protein